MCFEHVRESVANIYVRVCVCIYIYISSGHSRRATKHYACKRDCIHTKVNAQKS